MTGRAEPTMQVYWPKFGPRLVTIPVSGFDPAVHTKWEEYQPEVVTVPPVAAPRRRSK